uniref:Ig-like domain-containing protein n=1 Tax=Terrapene triunguis TaxID=2587831 RepID=A0A674JKL6_9SAUR
MASALTALFLGEYRRQPGCVSMGRGGNLRPGPSISVSPGAVIAPGGAVTIRCQCWCWGRRLFLYKDGIEIWERDGDGDEFPIRSAGWEDAGAYSCRSHALWEPLHSSYASDVVQIIVAGEGPGSVSPLPAPYPARPLVSVRPDGTFRAGWAHGGSQESLGSQRGSSGWVFSQGPHLWDRAVRTGHSDCAGICLTACLLLTAETYYPKPSISLRPSGGVALGGAVTLQCRGLHQNMRFLLYKDGNPNALQDAEPAGDVTWFPIRNVSRRDAGSYSCRYSTKSDPPVWSEPSDPVELVVAGEGPGSASPLPGVIALGGAVTIRCQCQCEARRLFLYKDGIEIRELDTAGDRGEFTIPSARQEDSGVYSCRSRSRSEPPNWSDPSDYMRIVVLRYPKPSISLRPSSGVALGGAVTIRCRGSHQNMRFLLHKFGNPNVLQDVVLAGNVAEFPICNISRKDAGRYRCYYCSKSDPPIWSEPSDHVKLVIAGEGQALPCALGHTGSGGGGSPVKGEQQLLEVWGPGRGGPYPQGELQSRGPFPGGCSPECPRSGDAQRSRGPGAAQLAPAPALNSLPTSPDK